MRSQGQSPSWQEALAELRSEVNGQLSETTLHVKVYFEEERIALRSSVEERLAAEKKSRQETFEVIRQQLRQELRQELRQDLRRDLLPELRAKIQEDTERLQKDLMEVTVSLAAARPQAEELATRDQLQSPSRPVEQTEANLSGLRAAQEVFEQQRDTLEKMQMGKGRCSPHHSPHKHAGLAGSPGAGSRAGHDALAGSPPAGSRAGPEVGPPGGSKEGAIGDLGLPRDVAHAGIGGTGGSAVRAKLAPLPQDQLPQGGIGLEDSGNEGGAVAPEGRREFLKEFSENLNKPLDLNQDGIGLEERQGMVTADCGMSDRMKSFIRRCSASTPQGTPVREGQGATVE